MVLNVDNKTDYLNDYHFQTLCMLYFPGEKFPPGITEAENKAYFSLAENDGKIYAKVKLFAGSKSAEGSSVLGNDDFTIPVDGAFTAQAAVGVAYLEAGHRLFGFLPPWGYLTGLRLRNSQSRSESKKIRPFCCFICFPTCKTWRNGV